MQLTKLAHRHAVWEEYGVSKSRGSDVTKVVGASVIENLGSAASNTEMVTNALADALASHMEHMYTKDRYNVEDVREYGHS